MRLSTLFGGGVPLGSMVSMPDTLPNSVTINGQTFLKSGVVALASAYPLCPFTTMSPGAATVVTRPEAFASVAWSPTLNLFAAVPLATTGNIYTSPDGVNWTNRLTNIGFAAKLVYWTGTRFVVFPAGAGTAGKYSTDGITWSAQAFTALASGGALGQVAQVGTYIIVTAVNPATQAWRSTDSGATWSNINWISGSELIASSTTFMSIGSIVDRKSAYYSTDNGATFGSLMWNNSIAMGPTRADGTYVYADNTGPVVSLPAGTIKTQDGVTWTAAGSKNSVSITTTSTPVGGLLLYSPGKSLIFSSDAVTGRNAAAPFASVALQGAAGISITSGNFAYGAGVLVCACGAAAGTVGVNFGTIASYIDNSISSSSATGSTNYMRVA